MFGLLLTLALLPQNSNQVRLHPADALVMVEIPDVPKMMAAYAKAPMIAMLHDTTVRESFYGAFDETDIDVDALLTSGLQSMGMPEEFAKAPLAGIHHYLSGIQAASFSLSLDAAGLDAFGPRAARLKQIAEQLDAIEAAIKEYGGTAEPSSALVPTDLAKLSLAAEAITDPWGRRYDYTVSADQGYTLRSLGADGKVGGSGEDADIDALQAKAAVAESFIDLVGFQLVIEYRDQAALDEVRSMVSGLMAKTSAKAKRSGSFQMAGIQGELESWSASEAGLESFEGWMMRAQNMLVIGGGHSTPEAFAERLADPRLKTAADQFYVGLAKDFGASAGATIVQGRLRLSDYTAAFRKFAEEQGEDVEGMEILEEMMPNASIRMQLVGDRFVTEMTTTYVDPKEAAKSALGFGPLPRELLSAVPEDAIGVYVASLDGALVWNSLKEELMKDEDSMPSAQEQLSEVESRYEFSVEHDIFGSLGSGCLMYLLPLRGVTSLPGMALVVDLKDPVKMTRGIGGLMAMLGDEAEGGMNIRSKPYRDAPVWTFSFADEETGGGADFLMNQFTPSVAIVKNRLIVTLNSTHIKKEIKRALGEEGGAHLIATEGHYPPADATTFSYMDWAALLNGVYEGGRGLANMFGSGMVPMDVSTLPEPGVFTHFYRPTIYHSRTLPNGTYVRNESSFGPEVWLGLAGLGFVGYASVSGTDEIEPSEIPNVDDDEEDMGSPEEVDREHEHADDSERRTETTSSMRRVATALAVCQMDVGNYPSSLEGLLTPTTNYPEGFLGKGGLPNDAWGNGYRYLLLEQGARYRLWSKGPDGVDQSGSGDDIVSP